MSINLSELEPYSYWHFGWGADTMAEAKAIDYIDNDIIPEALAEITPDQIEVITRLTALHARKQPHTEKGNIDHFTNVKMQQLEDDALKAFGSQDGVVLAHIIAINTVRELDQSARDFENQVERLMSNNQA